MLLYSDVESWLTGALTALGYMDTPMDAQKTPTINPGPFSIKSLQKLAPGPMVFATVGNGAGMTDEQLYDQRFVTLRILGPQNDYVGAEKLANDLDKAFLAAFPGSGMLGATRVKYVTRTGGAPQLVDYDDSQRYHFQVTYVVPASSGL